MPNIIRTSVAKNGTLLLSTAYASLAIAMIPLTEILNIGGHLPHTLYPLLGVPGFIWLWALTRGVTRTGARLSKEYLTASRHSEKLGLQLDQR